MYQNRGVVITGARFWVIMRHHYPSLGVSNGYQGERMELGDAEKRIVRQVIYDNRTKIERPDNKPVIGLNSPGVGYKMRKFLWD